MAPRQPFTQVDAFTDRPIAGNPAAVCVLPEPRDAGWMRLVAREMNLAETAFLVGRADGYDLRWFTPVIEVDLCGHATLASAHVLWDEGQVAPQAEVRFHTPSGLLTAARRSRPTGPRSSAGASCAAARLPSAAGWFGCAWPATGWGSAARR
jgi:PhzF family phenazine biosynthesis protein